MERQQQKENLFIILVSICLVITVAGKAQEKPWDKAKNQFMEMVAQWKVEIPEISTNDNDIFFVSWDDEISNEGVRVTVTQYNPVVEQCDDTPLVTADGSVINLKELRNGKIRWVAVSRDLREHFGYGSTIIIHGAGKKSGRYKVHDTMNPRFNSRIDILTATGESCDIWEDAWVEKEKEV